MRDIVSSPMKLNPRNSAQLEAEAGVQDEEEAEEALIPKLSLSSLPRKPREQPPGTVTPPLYTTVSIPFQWEEAPGRPRSFCSIESEPPSARYYYRLISLIVRFLPS